MNQTPANDEREIDISPDDLVKMADFIAWTITLTRGGSPLPFTLLIWHPEGARHISTVTKPELIAPLRKVADAFEREVAGG